MGFHRRHQFSLFLFCLSAVCVMKSVLSFPEILPDYTYDLDEDGIGLESGIDFGSPLEPFRYTSFTKHQSPEKDTTNDNDLSVISAETEFGEDERNVYDETEMRNTSFSTVPQKHQSKLSRTGDYVFGILLITFCFSSVVGNSCVLIVFAIRHRGLSPAEVFLVNLGVVDLLLSLASYPMSIISSFKHHWEFGQAGCTFYAFTCYFLGVASIFSVTGIALIRYLKTCVPVQGNQITCWTACKIILWGYVLSFFWAVLPLLGFGSYSPEPFGLSCTLDWVAKDRAGQLYIVLVSLFCVLCPLLIILFCYSQIIILVNQSNSLMRTNGVNKRNAKGSDVQLSWISWWVTLGFIVGWCPYSVVALLTSFRGEVVLPMWATPIPVLLAKSSIAYNPLIYMFFTSRYRDDLESLSRFWCFSQAKPTNSKERCNNNGEIGNVSFRKHEKEVNCNGNDSDDCGSSSLVTRQFTSSTQVTLNSTPVKVGKVESHNGTRTIINNNNNEAGNSLDNETCQHELEMLIAPESNSNYHDNVPSANVITKLNGTRRGSGTTTVVQYSSKGKLMPTSFSLLSLGSRRFGDGEEQV